MILLLVACAPEPEAAFDYEPLSMLLGVADDATPEEGDAQLFLVDGEVGCELFEDAHSRDEAAVWEHLEGMQGHLLELWWFNGDPDNEEPLWGPWGGAWPADGYEDEYGNWITPWRFVNAWRIYPEGFWAREGQVYALEITQIGDKVVGNYEIGEMVGEFRAEHCGAFEAGD